MKNNNELDNFLYNIPEPTDVILSDREILKTRITNAVGDTDSRQGKAWDLTEVLLLIVTDVFTGLHKAKTLEQVRSSVNKHSGLLNKIKTSLADSNNKMVHETKGLSKENVIDESIDAMNKISTKFE
jgi:hypothetical protein